MKTLEKINRKAIRNSLENGKPNSPTGRPHGAARGREEVKRCTDASADRRGPPIRDWRHESAGVAGLSGSNWLFLFSRDFPVAFLFIFSRVFNLNSNQVSNSN